MRSSWRTFFLGLVVLGLSPLAGAADFMIVANTELDGATIRRSVLVDIYQRDVVHWGDRTRILPIDQSLHAPVRLAFAREVLGLSIGEVQQFWRRRLAQRRELPPTTRASDDEVLEVVASRKGAIGYVTRGIQVPAGVKVLAVVD